MRPARIAAMVIGALLLLPGLAMVLGGVAATTAYAVARDGDYFEVTLDRIQTPTAAVRSENIDLFVEPGSPDWLLDWLDLDLRIEALSVSEGPPLFLGIGPADDVAAFLDGVAHDEVVEVDDRTPRYERRDGSGPAEPPGDQDFWTVSATGVDPTIEWEATSGEWAVVLLRADGAPGVTADVDVGARSGALLPIALAVIVAGLVAVAVGVVLVVVGARKEPETPDEPPDPTFAGVGDPPVSKEHPVALSATLDPGLSRWRWLVKWFLAIPHAVVLVVLWVAAVVVTIVAGIAILFTGRFPPALFRFDLGVLRWTWRVSYYAFSGGIGTDRYPPFSLGPEPDYPAVLDVAYPEHLSRGLVLVKWWLLAIPHYVVVGILIGGGLGWTSYAGDWRFEPVGGGLLGALVVITGVILLFTGRYPRSLFDLVVGFNRWIFRVAAYAMLMTDRYPPFRLDQGGEEPGPSLPPVTSSSEPAPHGSGTT